MNPVHKDYSKRHFASHQVTRHILYLDQINNYNDYVHKNLENLDDLSIRLGWLRGQRIVGI